MSDDLEAMKAHVRGYIYIGLLLLVATGVTVWVSYMDLTTAGAIYVGLAVATFKGSLVCAYFMHLIDEKKIIYATLGLTIALFVPLMFIPWATEWTKATTEVPHMELPATAAHPADNH